MWSSKPSDARTWSWLENRTQVCFLLQKHELVEAASRLGPGHCSNPQCNPLQPGTTQPFVIQIESPPQLASLPAFLLRSAVVLAKPPGCSVGDAESAGRLHSGRRSIRASAVSALLECLVHQSHQRLSGRSVVLSSLRVASKPGSRHSCGKRHRPACVARGEDPQAAATQTFNRESGIGADVVLSR